VRDIQRLFGKLAGPGAPGDENWLPRSKYLRRHWPAAMGAVRWRCRRRQGGSAQAVYRGVAKEGALEQVRRLAHSFSECYRIFTMTLGEIDGSTAVREKGWENPWNTGYNSQMARANDQSAKRNWQSAIPEGRRGTRPRVPRRRIHSACGAIAVDQTYRKAAEIPRIRSPTRGS